MASTRDGTTWDINDTVRLKYTVTDARNQLVDPTTIKLRLVAPSGTTTNYVRGGTPDITRDSLGVFYVEVTVTTVGTWRFRWETTSPGTAEEGSFRVRNPQVAKIN